MALTRPTTDQLTFRSSKTGVQNLDAYLEAAERGTRTLGDLVGDLFDDQGQFANSAFQFRLNEDASSASSYRKLQVRVGTFSDPEAGWGDLAGIFRPKGTVTPNTAYDIMDVVGDGTDLYLVTDTISNTEFTGTQAQVQAAFMASSKTFRILTGDTTAAASQYATAAAGSALQTGQDVTSAQTYRNEAQSYASGTPADGTSSALTLRDEVVNKRNEILNNSDVVAIGNDLNLGSSGLLSQVQPYLDELNTLINGIVTGSSPQRTNLVDVNSVAANMQNITTVAGLDTRMADILVFETQITDVGNDLAGNTHIAAVAAASQEIVTVGQDLASSNSQIANFNDGLSSTIDNLTINGVARGSVYTDPTQLGLFDLEESNNFFLDMADEANHGGQIDFKNAHNCRNMQPFTICVKQVQNQTGPLALVGVGGVSPSFKYPSGVAPALTSNHNEVITIGGYVLDPDPVNQTATIIIGHMVCV